MTMLFRLMAPIALSLAALPLRAEVNIQEVTSDGGITAWLVEDHSIPFTALELRFRGGASLDEPGKRGATYLMSGLLEEGSGDMDAQDFTRARENLAASFSYDVSDDTLSVSAKFLTENRDEAIDLLHQSLTEPRFDEDAITRVRAQVLSIIRSNAQDPNDIAGEAFARQTYGMHPYGTAMEGTEESVSALTREDLIHAQHNALAQDRLYVGAVGDITPDELKTLLDDLLGDLPTAGAPLPGPANPAFDGQVRQVPFNTPQSVVLFGQPGMGQDDPDFFAAYLLNTILGGGGFESRLMKEVRVKRGLTYGVYSYLVDRDQAKVWMGSLASANNRVAEAVGLVRDEWRKAREEGVTEEELSAAKKYLTGAYPLRFDGNGPIANILVGMQMSGMPIDYIATRNAKVEAVTLEDVNRVARELMDPEKLSFVVVGQPEGLDDAPVIAPASTDAEAETETTPDAVPLETSN